MNFTNVSWQRRPASQCQGQLQYQISIFSIFDGRDSSLILQFDKDFQEKQSLDLRKQEEQNHNMAQPVVSFVVDTLGNLLIQEAIFLSGVEDKVRQLQTDLRLMKSYLRDADRRREDDDSLKNWISEILEAAYDCDDIIETHALRVASRSSKVGVLKIKSYVSIIKQIF